jgi:hypothetical protein
MDFVIQRNVLSELYPTLLRTTPIALVLLTLAACDTTAPLANGTSAGPAPTTTPSEQRFRSSFDATKAANEPFSPMQLTKRAIRGTELALTPSMPPAPTPTSGPPTPTIQWATGIMGCPLPPNPRTYQPINCWIGVVNGRYVTVATAIEGWKDAGSSSDWSYTAVLVFNSVYTNYPEGPDDAAYKDVTLLTTPAKSGIMKIASAQGALLTLMPDDPHAPPDTLYFDAATRQFLPPSCGQDGTCTPTVTQVATQVPTTTAVH